MTPPPSASVSAPPPPVEKLSPLQQARKDRPAVPPAKAPAPKRSKLGKTSMHLTRRGHLYAGLLLVPWVFLYGVTGFLFNHPEVWSDQPTTSITNRLIKGTPLSELQRPAAMAAEVVAAINASGKDQYELLDADRISFGRGGLGASLIGSDGKAYSVSLGTSGTGSIRELAVGGLGGRGGGGRGGRGGFGESSTESAAAPFEVKSGLLLKASPFDRIEDGLSTVLSRLKMDGVRVSEVRVTPLSFQMESAGKKWQASYNPLIGSVTGQPVPEGAEGLAMSARSFLLRMHMAHGYPADDNPIRFVWAMIVDAMSLIMVFWGISGIVMWWQIKRTRVLGGICLLLSVASATYVGIGMHEMLANGVR
ncbi:hypothetical protein Pan44_38180 [Caulifigura coniformis]|uniref:PepSY-associated TM helix n=1 Tax=Caulifigura coniformis TaxID=2527983 RepID=A0A517SI21_9PLAN|nr:hypothetical protein [Caulifigura coniformis]QDT55770.1 hypothetical protein Pan44_38180 [Caulifigura coniformis]